jgi:hypothetical protein
VSTLLTICQQNTSAHDEFSSRLEHPTNVRDRSPKALLLDVFPLCTSNRYVCLMCTHASDGASSAKSIYASGSAY